MRQLFLIYLLITIGLNTAYGQGCEQEQQTKQGAKTALFAIKTNLLLDAVLCPNVALEIPIGKHWSVSGEWVFPWWLSNEKQNCFELQTGHLEGRYWFCSPTQTIKPMLCWFAGLYLGAGYYDFERDKIGYQGEFQDIGLSAGFAHSISRRLRLEYSLGIGFLKTKYRKYEAEKGYDDRWYLVRTETQPRKLFFGPTRASVSLVWMLTKRSKKGAQL